jgi:hypothetical protein
MPDACGLTRSLGRAAGRGLACLAGVVLFTGMARASCEVQAEAPAPAWMNELAGEAGFVYAKGSASGGSDLAALTRTAEAAALRSLAQSISVMVQSKQGADARVTRIGGKESVFREATDSWQAKTDLTLKMVQPAGHWFDRQTCTQWVRVRVSENAIRHQRLADLLVKANDHSLSIPDRRGLLELADALLGQIDFVKIADSEGPLYFRNQIDKERAALSAIDSDALAIFLTDPKLPAQVRRETLARLPGGRSFLLVEQSSCDNLESCVQLASRYGARLLMFGRISQSQASGMLGGISGQLSLELSLVDSRSGRLIWGPKNSAQPLVTFDRFSESDWVDAAGKAATAEVFKPMSICLTDVQGGKACS